MSKQRRPQFETFTVINHDRKLIFFFFFLKQVYSVLIVSFAAALFGPINRRGPSRLELIRRRRKQGAANGPGGTLCSRREHMSAAQRQLAAHGL